MNLRWVRTSDDRNKIAWMLEVATDDEPRCTDPSYGVRKRGAVWEISVDRWDNPIKNFATKKEAQNYAVTAFRMGLQWERTDDQRT